MRKYIIYLLYFGVSLSYAQNVGIGTNDPTRLLHVKGNVQTLAEVDDGFEDGNLSPAILSGDADWFVQGTEVGTGNFAIQAPNILNQGDTAVFQYPLNIPDGSKWSVSFDYRIDEYQYTLSVSGNDYSEELYSTQGVWLSYSSQIYEVQSAPFLTFELVADQIQLIVPQIFIDNIKLEYVSGHAMRIDDGSQSEGALLQSDGLGNVSWRSDLSKFIGDLDSTNELQSLNFNEGKLALSHQLDSVEIQSLSNGISKLHLGNDGNLNWGENSIADSVGSTAWGQNTRAEGGEYATAWGSSNWASGNNSTAWGFFTSAAGINSTSWGNDTYALGTNSTALGFLSEARGNNTLAWGFSSTATGGSSTAWGGITDASGAYSSAFGFRSDATAFCSTAWGENTRAEGKYSTVWGFGNTASSFLETQIGRFAIDKNGDEDVWISADDLFVIGNGSSLSDPKNALTLLKNGHLGLSHSDPSAILHIKQVGFNEEGLAIENDSDNDTWSFEIGANNMNVFFNGIHKVSIDDADGSWNMVSDRRKKKDIQYLENGILEKVSQLKPANYRYLDNANSSKKSIGFIAQEVQKVFPELVNDDEGEFLSLSYHEFSVLAIKAIQEQQKLIEALERRVKLLEK